VQVKGVEVLTHDNIPVAYAASPEELVCNNFSESQSFFNTRIQFDSIEAQDDLPSTVSQFLYIAPPLEELSFHICPKLNALLDVIR
jgi:hypothetical protein